MPAGGKARATEMLLSLESVTPSLSSLRVPAGLKIAYGAGPGVTGWVERLLFFTR